ncbi:hypothetical protein [Aquibacillus rhizosphaerae]|uniref:Uncharacterized protein n=1 Tax=Aquibacillus rhizosphaerae TaxID=3051431 RepID=A0ABT7L355_9BACI|nr:hypothetical protein [Aquibacillus sp. LR5S19]MDL4839824.1 hypothetical protein [Aquibacillus sp. LR5S19]
MVKYGKELFSDNVNQLVTIIVSLALAIVAQKLSGDIVNMSFLNFIKDGYGLNSNTEQFSNLGNVLLSFIMYVVGCSFLLWMGITNLVTYNEMGTKPLMFLKIFLGFFQLLLVGLIFIEVKLFSYFMLLVFTSIILIDTLNYAASLEEVKGKSSSLANRNKQVKLKA